MAKGAYIGVNNVARKIKKMYIGVNGVARKIKKAYIGVNGVARLFFTSEGMAFHSKINLSQYPELVVSNSAYGFLFIPNSTSVYKINNSLTISSAPSKSEASGNVGGASSPNYAYQIGGNTNGYGNYKTVYRYNTSGSRSSVSNLPQYLALAVGYNFNGGVIISSGVDDNDEGASYVVFYNNSGTQQTASLGTRRSWAGVVASSTKAYVLGGMEGHGSYVPGEANVSGLSTTEMFSTSLTRSAGPDLKRSCVMMAAGCIPSSNNIIINWGMTYWGNTSDVTTDSASTKMISPSGTLSLLTNRYRAQYYKSIDMPCSKNYACVYGGAPPYDMNVGTDNIAVYEADGTLNGNISYDLWEFIDANGAGTSVSGTYLAPYMIFGARDQSHLFTALVSE